jgi:predicted metalloendopeptidase
MRQRKTQKNRDRPRLHHRIRSRSHQHNRPYRHLSKTNKAIKPQPSKQAADFYTLINHKWQETTELPDTEARITQAYFIQERINKELHHVITSQEGPMSSLVKSWIAAENKVPDGVSPLIQIMMTMNSISDISTRIGWMNRYGISAPLSIYVQGDPRDHKRCRIFIEEGEPHIGIPEYWLNSEYAGHRKAYATYVKRLATAVGLPAMLLGYTAEREFARVFPSVIERKVRINMLTWTELNREYRSIDWTGMFTAWGLKPSQLPDLVYNVTSASFLHHLQKRMLSWSMQRWQGWFSLLIVQYVAGLSPKGPLRSAWFDYARRFLQGSEVDETPEELRHAIVRSMMPNTLGKLWVQRYCDPIVRRNVIAMVKQIQGAAASCLRRTPWMADSTKKTAIRKLRTMDLQIAWPDLDKWTPHEVSCGISDTDLISNLMTIRKLSADVNQEMLKTGDCRHPTGDAWGRPVFEVNAYYYPDENRFVLPAAILRPPFYDPSKPLTWNYGAIGATIGHEFCHAFDSDGRAYDENGNKRDWWTERDDRDYKKKANAVIRLYETRDYRGHEVDGTLTLVENIADIGGLEFALEGLKAALGRSIKKEELREFFTSFASSWRAKDRLKRAAELLVTDPHSPPMLRVNHVVRQFDEWYEAFDIADGAEGWIPVADRIHFFR